METQSTPRLARLAEKCVEKYEDRIGIDLSGPETMLTICDEHGSRIINLVDDSEDYFLSIIENTVAKGTITWDEGQTVYRLANEVVAARFAAPVN